jgi:NDP-sugar pyrophosphorylase family protein
MQAVILATNETNSLAAFSRRSPVALLPIADRPVVGLAVELLARNSLRDITVCLYQHAASIEASLGMGRRWGVNIRYAMNRQPLGNAGVLKRLETDVCEPCLVLPGDALIDLDIAAALAQHLAQKSMLTLIVHANPDGADSHAATPVCVDEQGRVLAVGEEEVRVRHGRVLASTGAYIVDPSVLDLIPPRVAYQAEQDLIPALLAQHMIVNAYEMQGYWNPLDSLTAYHAAQHAFLLSAWKKEATPASEANAPHTPEIRSFSLDAPQIAPGVWVSRNHAIHPSVNIAPPVYVGENCLVGRDVELGPFAVLGKNTIVDDEATVTDSTVLPNTYVGRLVNIEHRIVNKRIIGDPATQQITEVVDEFLLAETKPRLINYGMAQPLHSLIALLLLVVSLPLTLALAVVVWLTTQGQLFKHLPRVKSAAESQGANAGERPVFDLLRFQTRHSDGRYTLFGRWLEAWEWDRWPELMNVLRGDVQLVGVKPLSPDEDARVTEEWQMQRYERPLGLTGLWYLRTSAASDLDEVLVADAYYAATHQWRDDVSLFVQTPLAWLACRRARHA